MDLLDLATLSTWIDARLCAGAPELFSLRIRGVSTDSRTVEPGEVFFALRGQRHDGHLHLDAAFARGAAAAVVASDRADALVATHPGRALLAVADPVAALGAFGRAWRLQVGARVIAVTGSCGKTTTKDMTALAVGAGRRCVAAPRSFNNAIGLPLTLLRLRATDSVAVVEVGTSAPGEIASLAAIAQPDVAIVTCIGESHLEGLGDLDGVLAEKMALVGGLRRDGLRRALLCSDDPRLRRAAESLRARTAGPGVLTCGVGEGAELRAVIERVGWDGVRFRVEPDGPIVRLGVPGGRHLVASALLALAAAREVGVPLAKAAAALRRFRPADGRFHVSRARRVLVVDDTYNANPTSLGASLATLGSLPCAGRRFLVLGDMRELGAASAVRHREAGRAAAELAPERLVVVGQLGDRILEGALEAGLPARRAVRVARVDEVAGLLEPELFAGDVVLFKASRAVGLERAVDGVKRRLRRRRVARHRAPAPDRIAPRSSSRPPAAPLAATGG